VLKLKEIKVGSCALNSVAKIQEQFGNHGTKILIFSFFPATILLVTELYG
jgi:hypothetical protein